MLLLPLITLGVIALSVVYLSRRFSLYFDFASAKPLYFIFSFAAIFMIGGLIAFTNTTSQFQSVLYMLAAITTGIMLYLLLSTLFIDLIKLFAHFPTRYYGLASLAITILISAYGTWNSWNIRTSHVEIPIEGLTEEVRVAHLSDIHIGHFRGEKFMQSIVDKTKAVDPDMVFITGDLFDGRIRLNMEVIAPLKQLKVPIYFVEGNHDGYTNVSEIKQKLSLTGIHVLSNEMEHYKGLQIIGLNHIIADENTTDIHASAGGQTVKSVLSSLPISPNKPAILLHHSPDGVEYAHRAGIDLFLAGHTHAGQLWPINYVAHAMFAYNRGLHDYKGTKMLVSEGIGTFGPPMRVGTKSEIVVIDLKSK